MHKFYKKLIAPGSIKIQPTRERYYLYNQLQPAAPEKIERFSKAEREIKSSPYP
jgi:hypothetical protein